MKIVIAEGGKHFYELDYALGQRRLTRPRAAGVAPRTESVESSVMKARTSFGQHTLPRDYFVSPEIFQTERERIFYSSWLLVGHVSQLDKPGSYFLFELDRESVIVLRDGAGDVRAFHNHCRHRGSRLCQQASGELGATIQCPYHAWTYGLDGALRAVPTMADVAGFDAADIRCTASRRDLAGFHLHQSRAPAAAIRRSAAGAGRQVRASAGGRAQVRASARSTRSMRTGSFSSTTSASAITARRCIRY